MKKLLYIILILPISCTESPYLITNKSIGKYQLCNSYKNEYDKNVHEINSDENKLIKSILVKSKKYNTKQGFGVGSNLYNI